VLGHGSSVATGKGGREESQKAIERSIGAALCDAKMTPGDVAVVKANGAGTIEGDIAEAQAIREVLGSTPVFAPASFFGDLGAGGGAVELVAAVLAVEKGEAPVTLNYERPDPVCPVNVIHREPLPVQPGAVLALNQSARGQAVAAILAAP
jgi:3-oxoacyl-[acyl-carrier-protein] synthase II